MATTDVAVFSRDELDLIVEFAGCSLDESPGSNWVQDNGGLPEYICRIARAIKKSGKTTSQAISIAVDRVKVWASGKGVDKDTQGKAAAALAEWEALRAKSHAKSAAKKTVKASRTWTSEILVLSDSVTVFNIDSVRRAWAQQTGAWRQKYAQMYPAGMGGLESPPDYSFIKEMWTDHLIVCAPGGDGGDQLFRVDYSVGSDGGVTFADPQAVQVQYVSVERDDMVGKQMSNSELRQLMASVGPCYTSATDKVLLSIGRKPSALQQVVTQTITRPLDVVLSHPVAAKPTATDTFLQLAAKKA